VTTGVATQLFALFVSVSSTTQSMLGCLPTGILQGGAMGAMVVKFREQVEQCLHLKTFGSRICGLIPGSVDD
jgi:hypothetical protein